jgi:hypothetical protein
LAVEDVKPPPRSQLLASINTVSAVPYGIASAAPCATVHYATGPIGRVSHGLCVVVTALTGHGATP